MERVRLFALFLAPLCLFLYFSQDAAGQSPRARIALSPDTQSPAPGGNLRVRPPQPKARGPEIFYCETPDTSCRTTQDTFALSELRDLFVFVVWPGVAGQHVQTVEFYLPDGSLYSSKKTQFTIGGAAPVAAAALLHRNEVSPPPVAPHLIADANKIHAEGIPSLLMNSRGDSAILTVLPVAGSYITQRNFIGAWHVRVLLDDRFVLDSAFTLATPQAQAPPKAEARTEEDR